MNCLRGGDESGSVNNDIVLSTAPSTSTVSSCEFRRGAGTLATIFLIVNATLGAGLLNFPQAFDRTGGIIIAVIVQLALLVFITAALVILAKCSDVTNTSSMQETLAGLCGQKCLIICGICVTLYSFGCCITFLIIIGDQFDRLLTTYYGADFCHYWYLSRPFTTSLSCSMFILPLCFSKRLDVLSYASSIGCVTVGYVVWLIVYKSFTSNYEPAKPMRQWPDNWTEAFQIVPVICFGYQCHMSAIPTYACMKDRHLGKFTICTVVSIIICFLAYTIVGIFGYSTFGSGKVPSDILQGYSDSGAMLTTAIIAVAVKNFTTYPIILFCGREAMMGLCTDRVRSSSLAMIGVTIVWFVLSLAIAILVPDISPVINLMGSLSAVFIFILPGICLLQSTLTKDPWMCLNKDRYLVAFAVFMVALGAFVCGVVFVEAIRDLGREPSEPPIVTGFRIGLRDSLCV